VFDKKSKKKIKRKQLKCSLVKYIFNKNWIGSTEFKNNTQKTSTTFRRFQKCLFKIYTLCSV